MDHEPPHHRDLNAPCEGCGARWVGPYHDMVMVHARECPQSQVIRDRKDQMDHQVTCECEIDWSCGIHAHLPTPEDRMSYGEGG